MASKKIQVNHVQLVNPTVERAQNYVKMVAMGDILGCTLIGPAGMGKTHLVRQILDEMDVPYEIYGGHISLAECYEYMAEHHDKLIFFDDVSQVINKTEIMELFKQALNLSGHSRILNYRSKNVLSANCPAKFEFSGKIIMAFNAMDKTNPNVKAIMDRAPVVELKFNRKEILTSMYKIAEGDTGGLMEHEKLIVTREIENHTDITMDVSFRKQQIAFNVFKSFKKLYGEGNDEWKKQVQSIFGKKKRSWIFSLLEDAVGEGRMKRIGLAKMIALSKDMSLRTAQRRIKEALEMEEIFESKFKGGDLSIKPFKVVK